MPVRSSELYKTALCLTLEILIKLPNIVLAMEHRNQLLSTDRIRICSILRDHISESYNRKDITELKT